MDTLLNPAIHSRLSAVARKKAPADLCLKNGTIVNCLTGRLEERDIAVSQGFIAGTGHDFQANEYIDCKGLFICPGFIDAHIHIESTLLSPVEFAKAVVPRGTSAVVADPHEIANCLGMTGIEYMLRASAGLPISIYFTAPSCVPATRLETSGAELGHDDIDKLLQKDRVIGLGEMMNFPGVIYSDPEVEAKLDVARKRKVPIDGHSPGLRGDSLCAYISAGIDSDHECTTAAEAAEKLHRGMWVFLRQGTAEKNLVDLIPAVTPETSSRCCLVSDDRHPDDLMDHGHMDYSLRTAVEGGMDPVTAIKLATLNPATRFGLRYNGAIAPGYHADLVLLSDLKDFQVNRTIFRGQTVAREGKALFELEASNIPSPKDFNLDPSTIDFTIRAEGPRARVIGIEEGQIVTRHLEAEVAVKNGMVQPDLENDIIKLFVIERHHGTGNVGKGLVKGLGIKKGAIAGSVAHDSHNLIVAGVNDQAMFNAVRAVSENGGGLCAADSERVLAVLPLPISGLMSDQPLFQVRQDVDNVIRAAKSLGASSENPFMILSFLALPVIPSLKLTDKGLVDVEKFDFVPLFL